MPIYEYRCRDCREVFPRLQPLGAGTEGVSCPRCGSGSVERVLSVFSSAGAGGTSTAPPAGSCGPST